jgi:hypothetical protein
VGTAGRRIELEGGRHEAALAARRNLGKGAS